MSFSLNIIQGNLGQDPEIKYLSSGNAVCNLSIATSERWTDKASGEKKELTEWHKVSFFGKTAEVINQYFKKGDPILITGQNRTRKYQKDGVDHYITEIKGQSFSFVSSAKSTSEHHNQPQAAVNTQQIDDDIPF